MDPSTIARECRAELESTRNVDGGWGYVAGRASRLEPTALALVALAAAGAASSADALTRWPASDGLLKDPQTGEVNLAHNGQAALAAQALGLDWLSSRLHLGLVRVKGMQLPPAEHMRQDNSLQGWPWLPGTFSWVEPTAWCLLAVKRWTITHPTLDAAARIEEGERLLRDRACAEGGWNYGNAQVLGQALAPYVPTTALALLALGARAGDPVVDRAVAYLEAHRLSERSGLALSLARIALARHGAATDGLDEAIAGAWRAGASFRNLMTTALILLALANGDRHGPLAV